MDNNQPQMQNRGINLSDRHWATVKSFAKDQGYNTSLALRRIIDEWIQYKAAALDQAAAYNDLESRFLMLVAAVQRSLASDDNAGYALRQLQLALAQTLNPSQPLHAANPSLPPSP